ncbi:hypothetical protein DFJ73DRAFT_879344, partial [Zopfochytrium polystomum]
MAAAAASRSDGGRDRSGTAFCVATATAAAIEAETRESVTRSAGRSTARMGRRTVSGGSSESALGIREISLFAGGAPAVPMGSRDSSVVVVASAAVAVWHSRALRGSLAQNSAAAAVAIAFDDAAAVVLVAAGFCGRCVPSSMPRKFGIALTAERKRH